MAEHLLVETHGAWAGPSGRRFLEDAEALARAGGRVTVLLIEDGVTSAIAGATPLLAGLVECGVSVWVDGLSIAQRALEPCALADHVRVVDIGALAQKLLEPGVRAVWH